MKNYIYFNNRMNDSNSLIYYINRLGAESNVYWKFDILRNSSYPYCLIHFVSSGSGTVIFRNKKYNVASGQLFLLNAYEAHRYRANPDDPFKLNWIEFAGGDSVRLVNSILENNSPVILPPYSETVNKYILRILSHLNDDSSDSRMLIAKLIYSILITLINSNRARVLDKPVGDRVAYINKTIDYISKNLENELNIDILSSIAGFSSGHFMKIFHKVIGISPGMYVQKSRINRAKEILCSSDIQVELLSDKLSFCNPSHFIRVFKKYEGMTPNEYRKQSILYKNNGK